MTDIGGLQVEDEQKHAQIPTKGGADNQQTQELEDTVFKVSGQLSTISRMQKYFRTRENRNFDTVKSTESRIFNFSMIEVLMMVGMAALQVSVVRFFFQGARKGKCADREEDWARLTIRRLCVNVRCSLRHQLWHSFAKRTSICPPFHMVASCTPSCVSAAHSARPHGYLATSSSEKVGILPTYNARADDDTTVNELCRIVGSGQLEQKRCVWMATVDCVIGSSAGRKWE